MLPTEDQLKEKTLGEVFLAYPGLFALEGQKGSVNERLPQSIYETYGDKKALTLSSDDITLLNSRPTTSPYLAD